MTTIGELFDKYGSNKASEQSYGEPYEGLLGHRREDIKRVLEIGVLGGGSLQAWRDYFPNAVIVGVDNNLSNCNLQDDSRICLVNADQNNVNDLRIVQGYGPFDLIVDDGSHDQGHVLTSLIHLWDSLPRPSHVGARDGGLYVIEDMQDYQAHVLAGIAGAKWLKFHKTIADSLIILEKD